MASVSSGCCFSAERMWGQRSAGREGAATEEPGKVFLAGTCAKAQRYRQVWSTHGDRDEACGPGGQR